MDSSTDQLNMGSGPIFREKPSFWNRRSTRLLMLVIVVIVAFVIGILIGHFAIDKDESDSRADGVYLENVPQRLVQDGDPEIPGMIKDEIDPEQIRVYLRELTKTPHIAGRSGDYRTVEYVQQQFREAGLTVQTTPYDILLSYPNREVPNTVRLLNSANDTVYDSTSDDSDLSALPDVVPPFLGYSPSQLIKGNLVYVNYGRDEDFVWLRDNGINVTGHIVIARYGQIFRGDKIAIAAHYGAVGCILYSDPLDVTGMNMNDTRVYPDTWWLPGTGVQRGTIFIGSGDPLTPGHPATNLAYRYNESDTNPPLPKIPAHAIGYGAAYNILKEMSGDSVPTNWQGGLNFTYRLGPGFQTTGMKVELNVTSSNERVVAQNVFGIIEGAVEPDRYVLFGNHRDAWIYGAIDPSSGTAVMLELARVMGNLVKQGKWRPRRSIVFCSWGAEEYGLIGSSEWVEQYVATLRERAVGYVNVDIAVMGNDTLKATSTPLFHNIIYEASKKVRNPNQDEVAAGRTTLYDTWRLVLPKNNTDLPEISSLGSGSDYAPLLQIAGITAIDLRYTYDVKKYKVPFYPLYHTEYETIKAFEEQMDRGYHYSAAICQVSTEVVLALSDSLVLPFDVNNYAAGLEANRIALDADSGPLLRANLDNYDLLQEVIANFSADAAAFEQKRSGLNLNNPFAVRQFNDQIMLLERAFLDPAGLPARPLKKHLVFAESAKNTYAPSSFPGIVDLLFEIDLYPENWVKVKQHFAVLLQTIQSAGATLREVTRFMSETL